MHCAPYSHPRLHRVSVTHSEDSRVSVRARHGYAYCRSKARRWNPPPSSRRQYRTPCSRLLKNPHMSRLSPKVRSALSFYNLLRFQPSEDDSSLHSQFMHNDFFSMVARNHSKDSVQSPSDISSNLLSFRKSGHHFFKAYGRFPFIQQRPFHFISNFHPFYDHGVSAADQLSTFWAPVT